VEGGAVSQNGAGRRHRVLIVGGGFGGLYAARAFRGADVDVTLVDRRNFHLFQPLLYQVATGALAPGEIAQPLRAVFRRQRNVRVVLGEVREVDLVGGRVRLARGAGESEDLALPYDTLIVAAGARYSYFGHDEWQREAPPLKTIEDALELRRRILLAFEAAEAEPDASLRAPWLTFVVVGGGPTGVEMAGQIAEIARDTMRHDFRAFDPAETRVLLIEAAEHTLPGFPPKLQAMAAEQLTELGVTVLTGRTVVDLDEASVAVRLADGREERIAARTAMWAAGVAAAPLAATLAEAAGAERDRGGRIRVLPDLTLPGHPEVFAIGDMASLDDPETGEQLPGVAPVAMQQGAFAASVVRARLGGGAIPTAFHYHDKGSLATVGRARAVAQIGGLRVGGAIAWLIWLVVHLAYLIGFQNRLLVLVRWTFSYLTRGRGARLITGDWTAEEAAWNAAAPTASADRRGA
jgi:NADH dehydrogenase